MHYKLSWRQAKFPWLLSQNDQNDLNGQGQWLSFSIQLELSNDACLVHIRWFQFKSVTSYYADKPNFLEFWVKMVKLTLMVKVNDLHFKYQLRISHDARLVQIWWFQLKSVTIYHADKVKLTDGQTDRRIQTTTIPLWLEMSREERETEHTDMP